MIFLNKIVQAFLSVPGLPDTRAGNRLEKLDTHQRGDKVLIMNASAWNGSLDARIPREPAIAKIW